MKIMQDVKLYDTMTREIHPLKAGDGERFRMYVCGPTVYGDAHIGNFLTFVRFDTLYRTLRLSGYAPYYVRNITDVDDKTIQRSREEGSALSEFTQKWTEKFHRDCERLNLLKPDAEPRATDHIEEQISLVEKLIEGGFAYVGEDGSVYYQVKRFSHYGKLSHFDPDELQSQEANSAGRQNLADEYDRDSVADFALWKAEKPEDGGVSWDSPWGRGRPGWHLECSAMSLKYLGNHFDLHGGGEDLCFPHHENEIAQSEAATGQPFARHWMHAVHLLVEGKKMSKSLGNLFILDDLVEKGHHPVEIRLAMLGAHYRHQFNFTLAGIDAARSSLEKLERGARKLLEAVGKSESSFGDYIVDEIPPQWGEFQRSWDALRHDLNTPACLGSLHTALKRVARQNPTEADAEAALRALGALLFSLGLKLFYREGTAEPMEIPADIQALADERWSAKQAKDFARADSLRDELSARGWRVIDKPDGFELKPHS